MGFQRKLSAFERDSSESDLTPAEAAALQAVEEDGMGVTEYAEETGRAKGTVGNLLARARAKQEDQ